MEYKEFLESSAADWFVQLTNTLKKMEAGAAILTGCGVALKHEGVDEEGNILPVEHGDWVCSCGSVKDSMELADEHGPYNLYQYENIKEVDWFKENKS